MATIIHETDDETFEKFIKLPEKRRWQIIEMAIINELSNNWSNDLEYLHLNSEA